MSQSHDAGATTGPRPGPLDLSPMTFDQVEWSGRRLILDPPLVLEPTVDDESGQLLVLIDETLGLDVFAPTREQVADELAEQLLFQWDAYAREDPDRLTPGSRRLRDTMLARVREETLASR